MVSAELKLAPNSADTPPPPTHLRLVWVFNIAGSDPDRNIYIVFLSYPVGIPRVNIPADPLTCAGPQVWGVGYQMIQNRVDETSTIYDEFV